MSEIYTSILSLHLLQGIWSVILAVLFLYAFNVYKKHYLKLWSLSWWAFALYMFTAAFAIYLLIDYQAAHPARIVLTIFSSAFAYTQTILLIIGTWELVKERKYNRKSIGIFIAIALCLATFLGLLYATAPEPLSERLFIRVGLRSLITGVGFLGVGLWIVKSTPHIRSLGKKLLSVTFIIYGLEQLNDFVLALLPLFGIEYKLFMIPYLGFLEFLLLSLMGMGMLFWLLENERRDLEKANADLDSFFYSTSHDLRSPIASILGLTYLAKLDTKDPEVMEIFEKIDSRIRKLDEVINNILNYSKNAKKHLARQELDFNEIVDEVIGEVKFVKGASQIRLDYQQNPQHVFEGDKERLTTILNNLVSNSLKYHDLSKPDPYLKITFKKDNRRIIITVEDNGVGIDAKDHEKIFDMFYRASADSQGSGLGLFIVREAVKKLKGSISLESKPGDGSIFTIDLPT